MNESSKGPPDIDEKRWRPKTCREGERDPGELNPLTTFYQADEHTSNDPERPLRDHRGAQEISRALPASPWVKNRAPPLRGKASQEAQEKFTSISCVPIEANEGPPSPRGDTKSSKMANYDAHRWPLKIAESSAPLGSDNWGPRAGARDVDAWGCRTRRRVQQKSKKSHLKGGEHHRCNFARAPPL